MASNEKISHLYNQTSPQRPSFFKNGSYNCFLIRLTKAKEGSVSGGRTLLVPKVV